MEPREYTINKLSIGITLICIKSNVTLNSSLWAHAKFTPLCHKISFISGDETEIRPLSFQGTKAEVNGTTDALLDPFLLRVQEVKTEHCATETE